MFVFSSPTIDKLLNDAQMNGHRMHNIRKATQSDKEETCEFSTLMQILAYNTCEDTIYSLCMYENSYTRGYGITCGKKSKKG